MHFTDMHKTVAKTKRETTNRGPLKHAFKTRTNRLCHLEVWVCFTTFSLFLPSASIFKT